MGVCVATGRPRRTESALDRRAAHGPVYFCSRDTETSVNSRGRPAGLVLPDAGEDRVDSRRSVPYASEMWFGCPEMPYVSNVRICGCRTRT